MSGSHSSRDKDLGLVDGRALSCAGQCRLRVFSQTFNVGLLSFLTSQKGLSILSPFLSSRQLLTPSVDSPLYGTVTSRGRGWGPTRYRAESSELEVDGRNPVSSE